MKKSFFTDSVSTILQLVVTLTVHGLIYWRAYYQKQGGLAAGSGPEVL